MKDLDEPYNESERLEINTAFVNSVYDPSDPPRTEPHFRNEELVSHERALHELSTPLPSVQYDTVNPAYVEPRSLPTNPGAVVPDFADDQIVAQDVAVSGPSQPVSDFKERQNQGFRRQNTEGTNLLCGIYALKISLAGLRTVGAPVPTPSPQELISILSSPEYGPACDFLLESIPQLQNGDLRAELEANNYLSALQLALILNILGNKHHVSLRLGVCVMAKPEPGVGDCYNVFYADLPWFRHGLSWTVWVINDNARAMSQDGDDILNHWSGFAPNSAIPSSSSALQAPASERVPPVIPGHRTRVRRSRNSGPHSRNRSSGSETNQNGSNATGSAVEAIDSTDAPVASQRSRKRRRQTSPKTSKGTKPSSKNEQVQQRYLPLQSIPAPPRSDTTEPTQREFSCHQPNCKRKKPFTTKGALK